MWWTYIISFLLWFNIFFGLHYEIYDNGEYKKGRRVKIPLILWIVGIVILIFPILNILMYICIILFITIYYFTAKDEGYDILINPFPDFLFKRY